MSLGLIGTKVGMSRVFNEQGRSVPVTVLLVDSNRVAQVRTADRDKYTAVQIAFGARRPHRVSRAMAGHCKKAGIEPGSVVREFRLEKEAGEECAPGAELDAGMFEAGQKVDIQGVTKGRGFAGVVKRHGFGGGRASHGSSLTHRTAGSTGQCQDPGRVFPGKKMAGQLGNVRRTQQSLEVVRVDADKNLILVKGSVPGPRGGHVVIRPSVKNKG